MGEIVNLRQARKRDKRERMEADAARNRANFGVPKRDRQAARARQELAERGLEAHRLDGAATRTPDDAN